MTSSKDFVFTSESVGEGHPDKICDQISDAVLDHALKDDAASRVACETFVTTGLVLVGGEITTNTYIDVQRVARGVLKSIGYDNPAYGIDYEYLVLTAMIETDQNFEIEHILSASEFSRTQTGTRLNWIATSVACLARALPARM